jgi:predicted nucleic acid-binding protein
VKTYADTSLLFSLYSTDANSPKADAWRMANPDPLPFSSFHRLELQNALNLAVFQKRLTPVEVQSAWQEVENDIAAGLLVVKGGLWHRVFGEAESIAANHTSTIGCRTLDVLHVAAAKLVGVTDFCTFDTRQADLVKKVGMTAVIL